MNAFLYHLAWGLLHSLWLVTVLTVIYGVFHFVVPRRFARLRYCFGYAVLLSMLVLTVISCFYPGIAFPGSPAIPAQSSVIPAQAGIQEDEDAAFRESIRARFFELLRERDSTPLSVSKPGSAGFQPASQSEKNTMQTVSDRPLAGKMPADPGRTERPSLPLPAPRLRGGDVMKIIDTAHVYLPYAAVAWMFGVLLCSGRLCCDYFTLRSLRRKALLLEDGIWRERLEIIAKRLALSPKIRIAASMRVDSPILVGFFKPMILIPLSVLTGFSPSEIDAIVSHELIHIRRHDHWANLLQLIVETLLFYHPMMWWVSRRVRFEREGICDDLVVRQAETEPLIYVKTLVRLEELRIDFYSDKKMKNTSKNSATTLAMLSKPLLTRVRRILGKPDPARRRASWLAGALVLALFAATPLLLFLARSNPNVQAEVKYEDTFATEASSEAETQNFYVSKAPQELPALQGGEGDFASPEPQGFENPTPPMGVMKMPADGGMGMGGMPGDGMSGPVMGGMVVPGGMEMGGMSDGGGVGGMPRNPYVHIQETASEIVPRLYSLQKIYDLCDYDRVDKANAMIPSDGNRKVFTKEESQKFHENRNTPGQIYSVCNDMIRDSLPKDVKIYDASKENHILIVAPVGIHELIPPTIKRAEEMAEMLHKLYYETDEKAVEKQPTAAPTPKFVPQSQPQPTLPPVRVAPKSDQITRSPIIEAPKPVPVKKETNPNSPLIVEGKRFLALPPQPVAKSEKTVPRLYSLQKMHDLCGFDKADQAKAIWRNDEKREAMTKEQLAKLEDEMGFANRISTVCYQTLVKHFSELVYDFDGNNAIIVAPESVHNTIPEKIRQVEEMADTLRKTYYGNDDEKAVIRNPGATPRLPENLELPNPEKPAVTPKDAASDQVLRDFATNPKSPAAVTPEKESVMRVYSLIEIVGPAAADPKYGYRDNSLYRLCIRLLDEQMRTNTYEIPEKGAIIVIAPRSVHEEVEKQLKELEKVCAELRQFEKNEQGEDPSAALPFPFAEDVPAPLPFEGEPSYPAAAPVTVYRPERDENLPALSQADEPAYSEPIVNPPLNPQTVSLDYSELAASRPALKEDAVAKTEKLLEKTLNDLESTTMLWEVIEKINKQTGVYVKIDSNELDLNVELKEELTFKEATASTLLDRVLPPLKATYTITENGDVLIVDFEKEDEGYNQLTRFYEGDEKITQSLMNLYPEVTCIRVADNVLAVQATYQTHRKIRRFVDNLPTIPASQNPGAAQRTPLKEDAVAKTEKLLEKTVSIEPGMYDEPQDIVNLIREQTGAPFLDRFLLRKNVNPILIEDKEIPARKLLELILDLATKEGTYTYTITENGEVIVLFRNIDTEQYGTLVRLYDVHGKGITSEAATGLSKTFPDASFVLVGNDILAAQSTYQIHRKIRRFLDALPGAAGENVTKTEPEQGDPLFPQEVQTFASQSFSYPVTETKEDDVAQTESK